MERDVERLRETEAKRLRERARKGKADTERLRQQVIDSDRQTDRQARQSDRQGRKRQRATDRTRLKNSDRE